jgi:hypothetical protein
MKWIAVLAILIVAHSAEVLETPLLAALNTSRVSLALLSADEHATGGHVGRYKLVARVDMNEGDVIGSISAAQQYTALDADIRLPFLKQLQLSGKRITTQCNVSLDPSHRGTNGRVSTAHVPVAQ